MSDPADKAATQDSLPFPPAPSASIAERTRSHVPILGRVVANADRYRVTPRRRCCRRQSTFVLRNRYSARRRACSAAGRGTGPALLNRPGLVLPH